jgi:hypothetical protein
VAELPAGEAAGEVAVADRLEEAAGELAVAVAEAVAEAEVAVEAHARPALNSRLRNSWLEPRGSEGMRPS